MVEGSSGRIGERERNDVPRGILGVRRAALRELAVPVAVVT